MKIFRLKISKLSQGIFLVALQKHVLEGTQWKSVFTPNPEICLKTLQDEEFLDILNQADYLTSDGIGLYLSYQIEDSKLPRILRFFLIPYYFFNILFRKQSLYKKYWDRICGSDLTSSLVEFAQRHNIKIAILDPYYPNDIEKCASQATFREKLLEQFPKLNFDFYIYSEEKKDEIFETIAKSDAKILFSTLGMKRQEISVLEWLKKCPNLRLGLGVGSSFDYYTGFQKRAPKLWRQLGFEWLYRIFTSPNKIQRLGRIFKAVIIFPIHVIVYNEYEKNI